MADGNDLHAAVAAGVLPSEEEFSQLLRSIVVVARAIFGARGASVFLFDEATDELVFAALAGEDEQGLVGLRMPSSQGIAGWVLSSRTPLLLDDVSNDPRFSRDFAKATGYVPNGIMAVPLLHDEEPLGVLQVLDRPQSKAFSLRDVDLLGLFANQASVALALLLAARRARAALAGNAEASSVAALAQALERVPPERKADAQHLLDALTRVL
jgi:GAF domain-containing protein